MPAKGKHLKVASSSSKLLSKDKLMKYYELMLNLRRFGEKTASIYQQGKIGGFCHLYIGQEAVIAGVKAATKDDDYHITSYRCHAHALACGVSPKKIMAELVGSSEGISKGKGGSMHMFAPEKYFFGGHGIVSAQSALGTGIAFASKYKGSTQICITYLGDGAASAGQFFESLNMAALWDIPVLYIIENNGYGMGTAVERSGAGELYKRGEPFGVRSKKIDGMDFFAIYEAVKDAAEYVRKGKPMLLEVDTYRYRGHSMTDPSKYRTREEVNSIKDTRDPIEGLGSYLETIHKVTADELTALDKKIKMEVNKVAEYALSAPEPELAELMTEITPNTPVEDK